MSDVRGGRKQSIPHLLPSPSQDMFCIAGVVHELFDMTAVNVVHRERVYPVHYWIHPKLETEVAPVGWTVQAIP